MNLFSASYILRWYDLPQWFGKLGMHDQRLLSAGVRTDPVAGKVPREGKLSRHSTNPASSRLATDSDRSTERSDL